MWTSLPFLLHSQIYIRFNFLSLSVIVCYLGFCDQLTGIGTEVEMSKIGFGSDITFCWIWSQWPAHYVFLDTALDFITSHYPVPVWAVLSSWIFNREFRSHGKVLPRNSFLVLSQYCANDFQRFLWYKEKFCRFLWIISVAILSYARV